MTSIVRLVVLYTATSALLPAPLPLQRPAFEVATIKPAERVGPMNSGPGIFVASGQTLKGLVSYAYGKRNFEVFGGPEWITSAIWQVQAKAADGTFSTDTKRPDIERSTSLMLQSLLEDRFGLKVHRETREIPIYELAIQPGGLKFQLSPDQSPPSPAVLPRPANGMPPMTRGMFRVSGSVAGLTSFEGNAVRLDMFVNLLMTMLDRPVVDKTGLTGLYDMKLEWMRDSLQTADTPLSAGPSILVAVQEQLGLRLVSAKAPREVLVIDGVEKPSEN